MSVLNQSGEEQVECPLCMEPLEVDDLNFFPCTCGYQICRFCWHRIRTDENGLCPACRKAYSENPADFTPLSKEQVAQLKAEKRQRDQQRKAKLSESRKHLANVRVVQKNLVFVVGLPMRLADPEILKRHEYFGKFGKIHKVVINQSTSYAGSQGPSASAYVTYMKSDDALRAIQSVNNIMIDGRLVKSSLGTTKYCSHFMKNQSCPKPDCMYLHDFGDPEASFTKEQMHAGKHQEYEKKLHEVLLAKIAVQGSQPQGDAGNGKPSTKSKDHSTSSSTNNSNNNNNNKEGWPHLNNPQPGDINTSKGAKTTDKRGDKQGEGATNSNNNGGKEKGQKSRGKSKNNNDSNRKDRGKGCESGGCQGLNERQGRGSGKSRSQERDRHNGRGDENKIKGADKTNNSSREASVGRDSSASNSSSSSEKSHTTSESIGVAAKLQIVNENSSFFSQNVFQKLSPAESDHSSSGVASLGGVIPVDHDVDDESEGNGLLSHNNSRNLLESTGGIPPSSTVNSSTSHILNDSLPNIDSSEDWEAAFGFSKKNNNVNENDEKRRKEMLGGPFGNGGNGYVSFLGQQQQQQQPTLFGGHDPTATAATLLQNSFDTTKLHESILDVLNNKNNFFSNPYTKTEDRLGAGHPLPHLNSHHPAHHHQPPHFPPPNSLNGVNGLDQQMSKFFTDFCTKNSQNGLLPNGLSPSASTTSNGFVGAPQNGLHPHTNNGHHGHNGFLHSLADRHNFLIMQQKQIEEQLLTLKQQQQSYGQQLLQQHNGLGGIPSTPFLNGDVLGGPANNGGVFGSMHLYHHHNQQQQQQPQHNSHHNSSGQHHQIGSGSGGGGGKQQNNSSNRSAEDELDFDPFHETQKALAELIENEQNGKIHGTTSRSSVPSSQINGLVHSQNGNSGHVPPPPPGFVQPTNHMNSFGSKILPYLNMNSSPHQPINGTTTQNNWPANFNPVQQQKGLGNCNDWKVLDPAIVSSSRHFPLANMHMRDQYTSPLQQPQHLPNGLGGGPMRSFDYASFAGSPQQQQQQQQQQQLQAAASSAFSSFSHLTNSVQQNLNWLAGSAELGTQISSPPGFRTTAAGGPVVGKTQQEC